MGYDLGRTYTPGPNSGHADAMSRFCFKRHPGISVFHITQPTIEKPIIYVALLKKEVTYGEFCLRIKIRISSGNWKRCTKQEEMFFKNASALTINDDLIYNGLRVFIPTAFRKQVIEKMYDKHQCITALKQLVKNVTG